MKKLTAGLLALLLCLQMLPALADDPFAGMRRYEAGQYKVGLDFAAGEYVAMASSDVGGYICVSSDSLGRDIIFNELFDVNTIFTVKRGEYVELSRCVAVAADDFYSRYTIRTDNYGVMLKVGYDVRPGEYRLTAQPGETGYYCIYDDSRHDDIVANDLFENRIYITLRSGQYVVLNRCRIED